MSESKDVKPVIEKTLAKGQLFLDRVKTLVTLIFPSQSGSMTDAQKEKIVTATGRNMTDEEFANKVDYEGGPFGALDYGMRAEDIKNQDGELYTAWLELETKYDELKPLCDRVQKALDDAWGTDY
jgi:hypothetical protein